MTVSVVYKILVIVTVYAMISELDVIFPKVNIFITNSDRETKENTFKCQILS